MYKHTEASRSSHGILSVLSSSSYRLTSSSLTSSTSSLSSAREHGILLPWKEAAEAVGFDYICVGCSSNLDESSYAQIKKSTCAVDDCEHILCFGCFGRAQGESSANIKLTCPSESCSRLSGEWSIVEFKSGEHHNL